MAKLDLTPLSQIDGFLGATLFDTDSGLSLAMTSGSPVNLEVAAAGNTEVIKAKRRAAAALNLNDSIEDILITLGKQYHVIRPLEGSPTLCLYVAMDRAKSNLAMARHQLKTFEKSLDFK
jgi:predicted regulator of Ras-like GTPase activity (Roadblock/LC7/MglB family)